MDKIDLGYLNRRDLEILLLEKVDEIADLNKALKKEKKRANKMESAYGRAMRRIEQAGGRC